MKYESLQNPKIEFISCEECSYFDYTKKKNKELILFYKLLSGYNDERITIFSNPFFLYAYRDIVKIRIPIVYGELKRFFANYKEYYYLPKEDIALHKSVSSFVDKEFREQAKASNCYTRKFGRFLPEWEALVEPFFKREYDSKEMFFELTDELKTDREMFSQYASLVLNHLVI